MPRHRRRPDLPSRPDLVLATLGDLRKHMIALQREVRPFGPAYLAGHAITEAIDDFAALLTGDRTHFHEKGSVGPGRIEVLRKRQEETGQA